MGFESNRFLKGIEHLGPLYNAIRFKKILLITYQPFESQAAFDITLHPYYLKEYNGRWFLFGYNPEKDKADWNLPIDRMQTVKEIRGKYRKNEDIDWQEYFEDMVGVTRVTGRQPETIRLNFYGLTGKYIESKPLHGSQKHKWIDDATLEVTLQVIINYELERLIISYGETVKVHQPKSLAHTIRDRHAAALHIYTPK
jgi:predicted DNA-binding transcriptional regulator YafY